MLQLSSKLTVNILTSSYCHNDQPVLLLHINFIVFTIAIALWLALRSRRQAVFVLLFLRRQIFIAANDYRQNLPQWHTFAKLLHEQQKQQQYNFMLLPLCTTTPLHHSYWHMLHSSTLHCYTRRAAPLVCRSYTCNLLTAVASC